jgi:Histidine kinase
MVWPFLNKQEGRYWLGVLAWYAAAEACVQLLFFFIFHTFTSGGGSNIEYHFVMLLFHCLLIWPIWWVARAVRGQKSWIQVLVNLAFFFVYAYCWFYPIQDAVAVVYNNLQDITRPGSVHEGPTLDSYLHYTILNYQVLKHAFRLSWYYVADFLYYYRAEEKKKIELAISNKALELKLLKWHLNPDFYFKTLRYLQRSAAEHPAAATVPILQLSRIMEYVIYDAREPRIGMQKELQFLSNYVELLNRQQDNQLTISLAYTKGAAQVKIAPLLLAALIDQLKKSEDHTGTGDCRISISFAEQEMQVSVTGPVQKLQVPPLTAELYPDRYTVAYTPKKEFLLRIRLDAA